ncbi:fungal specific transcription factor domain-containing protein, partial [Aspergillus homomorphus CBS 101889]
LSPHFKELQHPLLLPGGVLQGSRAGDEDLVPLKSQQEALIDIYFRRIHPFLPLLGEDETRSQSASGTIPLRLLQSFCLTAFKDKSAAPSLNLGADPTVLPPERFSGLIYAAILNNLPRKEERRVLTNPILALLSLHGWGPHGCEDSTFMLSQAVHHSHTLGFHLARPGKAPSKSSRALFWCLWSLDRWSAAVNGRLLMIHDCDICQEAADVLPLFQPSFRIWLRIAEQLGWVIRSCRPVMAGNQTEQDPELCSFEEIVEASKGWGTSDEILGPLELFHHAIIILSTHSKGLQGRSRF